MTTLADVLSGVAPWVVLHGDCLEVLPTLPDKSVAHVICDPPYSEHVHGIGQIHLDRASFGFSAITVDEMGRCAVEFARLSARWSLAFCDIESAHLWRGELVGAGLDPIRIGAWVKPDAMPQLTGDRPAVGFEAVVVAHRKGRKRWNGGGLPAVWSHNIERSDRAHKTQKPVSLMLELVEQFTDPGDLVLDPFAGSGTTGVACLRLGRRFIGIEKDAKHHQVAVDRLTAESRGQSLREFRAGQIPMFSEVK